VTRRIVALALIALSTGGCAYLKMRNPQTADVQSCGRVPVAPWYGPERAQDEAYRELSCVEELGARGYERVPGEPHYKLGPVYYPFPFL
jgi:hypothetical protein